MPRIQVHEGSYEVETKGSGKSYDDNPGALRREERLEEFLSPVGEIDIGAVLVCECPDDKEHGENDQVCLNDSEDDKGCNVRPSRSEAQVREELRSCIDQCLPFRSIPQSQDEL